MQIARDWPEGRGIIFLQPNYDAIQKNPHRYAWINEEDHLRISLTERGFDLKGVFFTFLNMMEKIEEKARSARLKWMWDERLGFLSEQTEMITILAKINHLHRFAL